VQFFKPGCCKRNTVSETLKINIHQKQLKTGSRGKISLIDQIGMKTALLISEE
jgi:hypothetical protein